MGSSTSRHKETADGAKRSDEGTSAHRRLYRDPKQIIFDLRTLIIDAATMMITLSRLSVSRHGRAHKVAPVLLSDLLCRMTLLSDSQHERENEGTCDPCIFIMTKQILNLLWLAISRKYTDMAVAIKENASTDSKKVTHAGTRHEQHTNWCRYSDLHSRTLHSMRVALEIATLVSDCQTHEEYSLLTDEKQYSMMHTLTQQNDQLGNRIDHIPTAERMRSDVEFTIAIYSLTELVQDSIRNGKQLHLETLVHLKEPARTPLFTPGSKSNIILPAKATRERTGSASLNKTTSLSSLPSAIAAKATVTALSASSSSSSSKRSSQHDRTQSMPVLSSVPEHEAD